VPSVFPLKSSERDKSARAAHTFFARSAGRGKHSLQKGRLVVMTKPYGKQNSREELADLFRSVGLKLTNQRIAVYREVAENCFHPSVEEVYERVRKTLPAISLNTVYRVLTTLSEKGLLQRLDPFYPRTLYDADMREHHHLICLNCGRIEDVYLDDLCIDMDQLKRLGLPDSVGEFRLQFRGLCSLCAAGANMPSSVEVKAS
jgi:Fur family peroxide stress response transcriptional regulator